MCLKQVISEKCIFNSKARATGVMPYMGQKCFCILKLLKI